MILSFNGTVFLLVQSPKAMSMTKQDQRHLASHLYGDFSNFDWSNYAGSLNGGSSLESVASSASTSVSITTTAKTITLS